ncbi:MAG TPA: prolyl oligopeptidase family serine peptidase [Bacteroidota bacterium]
MLLFAVPVVTFLAIAQAPQTIVPGDNLVIDGIPPIPAGIAEQVGRYTEFRSASLESWNPKAKQMLITTRFGDVPQLHYIKFPGGARTQLTFFPERVLGGTFPPTRNDYILFVKDVGGGEWYQLYRYDMASGAITLLTDGKSRNMPGAWSANGDRLVYSSTKRNGKDYDFYIMDPRNPSGERMLAQLDKGEAWGTLDWSRDGKTILAMEEVSANESYLWLINASTGAKSRLTEKGKEQVAYSGGKFSPDGKSIYTTTDKESEFMRLASVDLATKKHTYLTSHIKWDVSSFDLSRDGNRLAYVTNEDGIGVLHVMDTGTRKDLPMPQLPVGQVFGILWHEDNVHLGFNISSAHSTADVYSLNIATGEVERWTTSETGGLNTEHFPGPELVKWKTFDGKMISGFLYRPPATFKGKRPVIVNIHGGPEGQFTPGFLGRTNYYLNEMGIAAIFPNTRGSSGYGKTFLKLDNGFLREDSYKDLDALLDWIKTQPGLDGDRIMVTGGSYGGHATLAVASRYAGKIRCAVDVVGMSNLVTFLEHTEPYRRDLRRVEYGDERDPKMREFLEKIAPMNNAAKITKPLFVVQGKNDPRVPASEADQIVATLKQQKTPVWYLTAKDEGHGFAKKKNADFQFYATIAFIQEYLLK